MIGSTLGGAGGIAYGLLAHPSPKGNMLISSAAAWGSIVGFELGGGGTSGPGGWRAANDGAAYSGSREFAIALSDRRGGPKAKGDRQRYEELLKKAS